MQVMLFVNLATSHALMDVQMVMLVKYVITHAKLVQHLEINHLALLVIGINLDILWLVNVFVHQVISTLEMLVRQLQICLHAYNVIKHVTNVHNSQLLVQCVILLSIGF